MDQKKDARDEAPYMQSVRERVLTSKRRLSVSDLEKILHEEIIFAALQEDPGKLTKASPQQQARGDFSEMRLESVLYTDCHPKTGKSCDTPWLPPGPKHSTHEQKHGSGLWLPKLPSFLRIPKWRRVRVRNLEMP